MLNNFFPSPIHYMGNKFDLLNQIFIQFPDIKDVDVFYDIFGGSGCVSLNCPYNNVVYNEININIVGIFKLFKTYSADYIIKKINNTIIKYNLAREGIDIRQNKNKNEREKYKKAYLDFRKEYNKQEHKDYLDLYTLTFYSFCNLVRFNSKNDFNMPCGNQCFSNDDKASILNASNIFNKKNIIIKNEDAFVLLEELLSKNNLEKQKLFLYLDPPYTNTMAIYNEQRAFGGWTIKNDLQLFGLLDKLSVKKVKFALSNVLTNKTKQNNHIIYWANKNGYHILHLNKNYSSLGKGNANSDEVLITNYLPRLEQLKLF